MINNSKKGDSGKRRETARNVGTSFCLSAILRPSGFGWQATAVDETGGLA